MYNRVTMMGRIAMILKSRQRNQERVFSHSDSPLTVHTKMRTATEIPTSLISLRGDQTQTSSLSFSTKED